MLVGMHLSARESDRRWPKEHFIRLGQELIDKRGCAVMLTWAPGERDNPFFPGDDETAREVAAAIGRPELIICPTENLESLCAAISLCDLQISSDGGPVHLAASLGKPVLCFFGGENPVKWHPWGVKYALIRKPSCRVADITVDEALAEFDKLRKACESPEN
jgi:heptosyltransferase III